MKVFLAPPKGLIEKETYIEWLLAYGFKPTILEVETKITAPLILAGGADIGVDLERDAKEFWWIQQALSEGHCSTSFRAGNHVTSSARVPRVVLILLSSLLRALNLSWRSVKCRI